MFTRLIVFIVGLYTAVKHWILVCLADRLLISALGKLTAIVSKWMCDMIHDTFHLGESFCFLCSLWPAQPYIVSSAYRLGATASALSPVSILWRFLQLLWRPKRRFVHKGKVFPYSLPSVGPGADPGVQAVSPQVTWSESRHRPGSSLPLLSARPAVTSVAFTRWRYL